MIVYEDNRRVARVMNTMRLAKLQITSGASAQNAERALITNRHALGQQC